MTAKVSCYFQQIEAVASNDDATDVLQLHVDSFTRYGWEVVMVDESTARQHPLFPVFDNWPLFAMSRNPREYTRACYMRWLAYASAGNFFADLDVINYGFTPEDAHDLRRIAGGPNFLSVCGAAGLFLASEYNEILNAFLQYQKQPFVSGLLEVDVNDISIMTECRRDLFELIARDDVRISRDYSCSGWEAARLVHYPYYFTKPPRAQVILSERPIHRA